MYVKKSVNDIKIDPETFDVLIGLPDSTSLVLTGDDLRSLVVIYNDYHASIESMMEDGDPESIEEISSQLKALKKRMEN
jgi:hypothetical protein